MNPASSPPEKKIKIAPLTDLNLQRGIAAIPPKDGRKVEARRDAIQHHFCELCQKGYARSDLYDAHLSSYDHSHASRKADLTRRMRAWGPRLAGNKSSDPDELASIKPIEVGPGEGGGGKFKKGGFKKIGGEGGAAVMNREAGGPGDEGPEIKVEDTGYEGVKIKMEEDDDDEPGESQSRTGGFKPAFGAANDKGQKKGRTGGFKPAFGATDKPVEEKQAKLLDDDEESDPEDFGYEYYDPTKPTDCGPDCREHDHETSPSPPPAT